MLLWVLVVLGISPDDHLPSSYLRQTQMECMTQPLHMLPFWSVLFPCKHSSAIGKDATFIRTSGSLSIFFIPHRYRGNHDGILRGL